MSAPSDAPNVSDPGLAALVMLLRFHEIGADREQILHRFGVGAAFGTTEMLRCAKAFDLKARSVTSDWSRLAKTPLPAIASLRGGGFLILGKLAGEQILVQDSLSPRPATMTRAELEAVWDGQLILMTRRAALSDLARRFDLTWFMGRCINIAVSSARC